MLTDYKFLSFQNSPAPKSRGKKKRSDSPAYDKKVPCQNYQNYIPSWWLTKVLCDRKEDTISHGSENYGNSKSPEVGIFATPKKNSGKAAVTKGRGRGYGKVSAKQVIPVIPVLPVP
tara:strand:+ start:4470 stop:4820 length:351 start_codon:yes stop_codon:yes gene_type:complete